MLPCSKCKAELVPITSVEALTFFCDNGHETTVEDLVGQHSESVASGISALINAWHKNAMALEIVSREAKDHGHGKAAEVFSRHISTLESRIEMLKKALSQHPPEKA